jgi:hypothetical protein
MALRGGWKSFAHRRDAGVLSLNALVTEKDRERVTEMRNDEWRREVPIRGSGFPRGGRNRRNTVAEMWNSGELIRHPGSDLR